jgi:hypothetical protein
MEDGFFYTAGDDDCILSLAAWYGFLWQTIWNHPQNSDLHKLRKHPNVLFAGDRVFIPYRRLRKLEAQLTDSCSLVPYSQKWLEYWEQRIYRMFTGEEPGEPGCISLEVVDAVREAWKAEAVGAEVTEKDLAPVGG